MEVAHSDLCNGCRAAEKKTTSSGGRGMGDRFLNIFKALYRGIPSVGGFLANLAICAMAILVVLVAALRYGFQSTPGWGDSVCAFLVVFSVFMGAGHTLIKGEHIRIMFIFRKLPVRAQTIVESLCGILALFYVGYLIFATADLALMSYRLHSRTPDGLLLFPLQVWLPVGLFMLFVAFFGFTIKSLKKICGPAIVPSETSGVRDSAEK
jgi:TRAP-type C4-dicarboxylate transport system permease small subunit